MSGERSGNRWRVGEPERQEDILTARFHLPESVPRKQKDAHVTEGQTGASATSLCLPAALLTFSRSRKRVWHCCNDQRLEGISMDNKVQSGIMSQVSPVFASLRVPRPF
jgi:hypothetical protein